MDKNKARLIADDLTAMLNAVATKHGLTVKLGGGTFDGNTFKPKIVFSEAGSAKSDFERYAPSFGLAATDFGKTFYCSGRPFTVTGLRLKARKRPVEAISTDGRTFLFTTEALRSAAR